MSIIRKYATGDKVKVDANGLISGLSSLAPTVAQDIYGFSQAEKDRKQDNLAGINASYLRNMHLGDPTMMQALKPEKLEKADANKNLFSSALSYGSAGAKIGTAVGGPIGAAIGTVAGAIGGLVVGGLKNENTQNTLKDVNKTYTDINKALMANKRASNIRQDDIARQERSASSTAPGLPSTVNKHRTGGLIRYKDKKASCTKMEKGAKVGSCGCGCSVAKPKLFRRGGPLDVVKENIILDGPSHEIDNNTGVKNDKGLPIVSLQNGGKFAKKAAEIESGELVLNLRATKQAEILAAKAKKGDEKAAEELASLLELELGSNTHDYTKSLIA